MRSHLQICEPKASRFYSDRRIPILIGLAASYEIMFAFDVNDGYLKVACG